MSSFIIYEIFNKNDRTGYRNPATLNIPDGLILLMNTMNRF